MNVAHLDFEARSGVDITEVGSHRFSIDPRFEILLAGVCRDGDDRVYLWVNPLFQTIDMMGENEEAEKILNEADLIYAHNAPNELANAWGAFEQGKACPFWKMPSELIFRCTAAMSRKAGLPGALEKVCEALNLPVKKSRDGKRLINLFCAPDEDTGLFVEPASRPDDWIAFGNYNITDVLAEKGVHHSLKAFELTGAALETFQFDLRMNQRGIPINVEAARHAQIIIDQEQSGVTEQFRKITGLNPTQKKKLKAWFGTELDLKLVNMQAATIEAEMEYRTAQCKSVLNSSRNERIVEILTLYQKVGYSAVAKIAKMLECVCPDGRVRGGHMYHGAGTGRWSGRLLQPQNFKKCPPWMREEIDKETKKVTYKGVAAALYELMSEGIDREIVDQFGDPLEIISGMIRHFIQLPNGQPIFDGDYSGVEARIIAWSAGQDDVVQEWIDYDAKRGPGPYKLMAAYIYEVPVDSVTEDQREVGKRVILGAGFQMGPDKFQSSCKQLYQLDLPHELCVKGIKAFRKKCKKIRDYWWTLNNQALSAVRNPGSDYGPFRMRKIAGIPFLLFRLRSGRSLAYPHPEINLVPWENQKDKKAADTLDDDWEPKKEEEIEYKEELTYWGEIKNGQWGRVKLYGGKLAENETQATAADFMSHGLIQAERDGMEPFMTVHDQGLAPVTEGKNPQDFERALGTLPDWAKGFPMKVEVKITPYYKK